MNQSPEDFREVSRVRIFSEDFLGFVLKLEPNSFHSINQEVGLISGKWIHSPFGTFCRCGKSNLGIYSAYLRFTEEL